MTKNLRKEIILRSKFRNVYLKTRTNESKQLYNKQRNLCVTLFRKAKKDYFSTLDNRIVSDNRKFWKAINPLFSEKTFQKESITLIDKETGEIISKNEKIAESFNSFYSTMVENLKIDPLIDISNVSTHPDPILRAIETYKNHSSVLKIKAFMRNRNLSFSFSYTTKENISKALKNLDQKKACQGNDIPVKMIKFSDDIVSDFIYHNYNNSLFSTIFPSVLQKADISPIHKKKSKLDIENYRPVSILPVLSKIYERCMFNQMYAYFNNILSKHQCGFRQGYSTQHSLLLMIEKFKKSVDNGNLCGMLLTDLSKAFDCLKHDLLIAKLAAYGFDHPSLCFIHSYLSGRVQRTKVNEAYSSYTDIKYGVPQGSILGPLLFNIDICDLFLWDYECEIASYADDNTPYTTDTSLDLVLHKLENSTHDLFKWFKENHMKANPDKCHLLLTTNVPASVNINSYNIKNSSEEKLLGIKIDNKLSFESHVSSLCKKASQKLHTLTRIANYMDLSKRRTLMKTFVISQFNYCPLVWMFHSRKLNNRINSIHERALRITYKDYKSSFNELLQKDNAVTIHQRNLQALATEIIKIKNDLSPEIMKEVRRKTYVAQVGFI